MNAVQKNNLKTIYTSLLIISIVLTISQVSGVSVGSGIQILPSNIAVLYDEFDDSAATTNFSSYNVSELAAIDAMTLDNKSSGRIIWLNTIDLTLISQDSIVDLDSHIELADASLFVNTSYFLNLASEANISLNGLSFADPQIMRNNNPCGTDCVIESYENGVITFITTGLTAGEEVTFTIEESSEDDPDDSDNSDGDSGGSGGGSTTDTTSIIDFSAIPTLIEVTLFPGEQTTRTITIENTGEEQVEINAAIETISQFLSLNQNSFELSPNETTSTTVQFEAPEDAVAGVYTGTIRLTTENLEVPVFIIFHIENRVVLFDLESSLSDITLTILQDIRPTITMTDIGGLGPVNVLMEYFVRAFDGNETKIGEEELTVDGSLEIERSFPVPNELEVDDYVFYAKLTYQDSIATTASTFKIISVRFIFNLIVFLLLVGIIIFVALVIFLWRRHEEQEQIHRVLGNVTNDKLKDTKAKRKDNQVITRRKKQ